LRGRGRKRKKWSKATRKIFLGVRAFFSLSAGRCPIHLPAFFGALVPRLFLKTANFGGGEAGAPTVAPVFRFFVNGGSGGVGSCVVQMAKILGARVITTAGSAEKVELCRQLGATWL